MALNFTPEADHNLTTTLASGRKLRVLIITEEDPLYVINFFDVFFSEYDKQKIEICAITICRAFNEPLLKTANRLIQFYGLIDFIRLSCRFFAAKVTGRSIAQLAHKAGVLEVPCKSINDHDYVREIHALEPDVIASVCAPEIFRRGILDAANLACVNVHSGRLPTYRGMMPTFWQTLNGEQYATVTVHEMTERLDAGRVLGAHEFPLRKCDNLHRIIVGTKREGARLLLRVLLDIASGTEQPIPVDLSEAMYFSFPGAAEARAFRTQGHQLL